jgi:hypothetical protein
LHDTPPGYVGPRHSKDDDIIGIQEMDRLWSKAGHVLISDGGTGGWDMFFPDKHFDKTIVTKFANFVNADPIDCWISRIHPGNMTPWHWDCNDKEDEYMKLNISRFTCHISKPQPGHAVMIADKCLYFQDQGNTWKWPARTSWHGGVNCGFSPKYLFNFSGIPK